jgi:hypothetical protein
MPIVKEEILLFLLKRTRHMFWGSFLSRYSSFITTLKESFILFYFPHIVAL